VGSRRPGVNNGTARDTGRHSLLRVGRGRRKGGNGEKDRGGYYHWADRSHGGLASRLFDAVPYRSVAPIILLGGTLLYSDFVKRPPIPQLLGFLAAYDPAIADLALALRQIVLEEAPDASESIYQVYTVAIWFGFGEKMKDAFCYITTHARHVNLGFPRGATQPDPNGVLQGDGKTMRHIKFASEADLQRPFVRRYIQAAMEQAGAAAASAGTGKSVVKSARDIAPKSRSTGSKPSKKRSPPPRKRSYRRLT
jgi:hypothetical protein